MKDHINLLSKAELLRGFTRKLQVYNNKHVLFWDYDEPDLDLTLLQEIVDKHNLDLTIIKTKDGFHFVDFHLFEMFELEPIHRDLQKYFPSDYPTILQMYHQEKVLKQEFLGVTLRLTKKTDLKPDLVFFTALTSENTRKYYSSGHVYIYKLVLSYNFMVKGDPIKTNIHCCSYHPEGNPKLKVVA